MMAPADFYPSGPPAAPYGPGYPGVPPAGQGAFAPPIPRAEDPTRPQIVLGGRRLTDEEAEQVRRIYGRRGTVLNIVLLLCMAVLLLYVFLGFFNIDYWMENLLMLLVTVLVFGAGFGLFVWTGARNLRRVCRAIDGEGENRAIEIYSDRIVSVSASQRLVLPFSRVYKAVETSAFFLFLGAEGRYIAVRAADLTPFDAQKLRETILRRFPAAQRETRGWLLPALGSPLPIPVFSWGDPEVSLSAEKAFSRYRQKWAEIGRVLLLFYSFAMVMGVRLANSFWITPYYILDSFLFSLAGMAVFLLLYGIVAAAVQASAMGRLRHIGELPLHIGVCGGDFLVGNRWYLRRVPRAGMAVKKTRGGLEFRLRKGKKSRWIATVSRSALPDPAAADAFLK